MKKIMILSIMCMLLVGCGKQELQKDIATKSDDTVTTESVNVDETEETSSIESVVSDELEEVDTFSFAYDENNNVKCSIGKESNTGKTVFLCFIDCEDDKVQFSCLSEMRTMVRVDGKFDSYLIMYELAGETFMTLFDNGELLKRTSPEISTFSADEEQIEKQLEYSDLLDEFLEKNGF